MSIRGGCACNHAFDKFRAKAKEAVWIQNWMNCYYDGKEMEAKLKAEIDDTRKALSKMTIERNRLFEQCKLLKRLLDEKEHYIESLTRDI